MSENGSVQSHERLVTSCQRGVEERGDESLKKNKLVANIKANKEDD